MNETELQTASGSKGGFMSRFGRRGEPSSSEISDSAAAREGEASAAVPVAAPAVPRREEGASSREMNVFTEGLTIEGNVTSETGIIIRGTVKGSVTCRADVEISGEITGDVEGKNVRITGGGVQGDITAGEMLSIDRSRIKGNLSATHARINNIIEGDITVRGTLTLQREADIQGNITAAGLSVEEGASMNGRITISREVPVQAPSPRLSSGAGRTRTSASSKGVAFGSLASDEGGSSDGRLPLTGEAEAVRHEA